MNSRDYVKDRVLSQGQSVVLKVPTDFATTVRYYAKFESAGTVDATMQPRGSFDLQGKAGMTFIDGTPVNVSSESTEIQELNQWPFSATEMEITNNSADDLTLEAGLIARG